MPEPVKPDDLPPGARTLGLWLGRLALLALVVIVALVVFGVLADVKRSIRDGCVIGGF